MEVAGRYCPMNAACYGTAKWVLREDTEMVAPWGLKSLWESSLPTTGAEDESAA